MPDADDEVLVTCQNCEASAWIDVWNTRPASDAKYVPELVRALQKIRLEHENYAPAERKMYEIATNALANIPQEYRK